MSALWGVYRDNWMEGGGEVTKEESLQSIELYFKRHNYAGNQIVTEKYVKWIIEELKKAWKEVEASK